MKKHLVLSLVNTSIGFVGTTIAFCSVAFANDAPIGYKNISTSAGNFVLPVYALEEDGDKVYNPNAEENRPIGTMNMTGQSIRPMMSSVKHQGERGTCNVFAAIAIVEAFTGKDYSEQCLAYMSSNQDGGFTAQRLNYINKNGLFHEKDCPYSNDRNQIPNLQGALQETFSASFEEKNARSTRDPIQYIRDRVHSNSPVGISFYVVGDWNEGFIYTPSEEAIQKDCPNNSCGGHAVVATGYNDFLGLIEFKNSWGNQWGKGGYGYMSYDYFMRFRKSQLISY
jgi:C1A family cysteine protease